MSDTPKLPSLWSPSLILKRFWFWDQDVRILPCTIFRGPSAVPGRSVVNANNLDRAVKRHENVEKRPGSFRRVFKSWQRVFVRLCIHHHLDVARQLHQEMAIFDEYLVSSKVRMSNTPKFPSLSSPSLILKGFWFWDQDAKMMPSTMFIQCSGVHQQFLADEWSVPTTGDGKIEQRQDGRDVLEESSTPGKGHLWDLISMIYYVSIITLKYSFESGVKMHGCLSHEFAKAMQQCWTRRRVKRVLVCRTTHHERSGCILVQMLSFPSPSIYATWDEPWHIRMHHFFGSNLRSPIDNGLW